MVMARAVAAFLACVFLRAYAEPVEPVEAEEPEECLLQMPAAKANQSADKIPKGPKDKLSILDVDQWHVADQGMKLAYSSYQRQWTAAKKEFANARLLKEVDGPVPGSGAEFMQARLIRTGDGKCWVVFRGTANPAGWDANRQAGSDNAHYEPVTDKRIWVPSAWLEGYKLLENGLQQAVHHAYGTGDCQPDNMYLTGHSLGGVLANYAALLDLVGKDGHHAKYMFTAGSPRPWIVSPRQCKDLAHKWLPPTIRAVRFEASHSQDYDVVPGVPSATSSTLPEEYAFHHCASHNIGLYTEKNTLDKCKKEGLSMEECQFRAHVHGMTPIGDNEPRGDIDNRGQPLLHKPRSYATMIAEDAELAAEAAEGHAAAASWRAPLPPLPVKVLPPSD